MHGRKNIIIAFLLAASLTALSAQAPPVVHGRYRYILNGFGPFTKVDTVSERTIFSYELATRTGKLRIPPTSGPGAVDGCLSAQAIYDAARGRFYTVVAEHYKSDPGGTNNFRVLAFSVPGIQLVGQWPAGKNVNWEADQPFIDEIPNGVPKLILPNERPIQNEFDISSLEPERKQISNSFRASSGDSALLYLSQDSGILLAVAHPKAKTLIQFPVLNDVYDSPDGHTPGPSGITPGEVAHLTPGGGYVVVERTNNTLDLFDAKTGKKVKSIPNPKSEMKYFDDICPAGKVIFSGTFNGVERYRYVSLGMIFPNVPVERNDSSIPCGGAFYADR